MKHRLFGKNVSLVLVPLAVGFAVAVGCGGANGSDLLTGDGGGGSSSSGSGHDSGGGDGSKDATSENPVTMDMGVNCPGQGFCMVPAQVCCLDTSGGGSQFSCTSSDAGGGDDASGGCAALSIPCDDATDCAAAGSPGDVCCVTAGSNDAASEVACVAPDQCSSQGHARVCNPMGPPDQCPNGKTCRASTKTLPGFYLCL
jgi:hypothetical protein